METSSCTALGTMPLPRAPSFRALVSGAVQDVAPHLSPTNLASCAARSQTSKNVKHVDARSGGRGAMLIGGC